MLISIGKVAELFGVNPQTVRNWCSQGILKAIRTFGGHRRFDEEEVRKLRGMEICEEKKTVIYARVSSNDQKDDLERQAKELEKYCKDNEENKVEIIKDIGSGINYKKRGIKKLIKEIVVGKIGKIIISYQDRLLRFGSEILFQLCELMGVEVLILKEEKQKNYEEKLVEDVLAILIVYSSKIYGHRSHKNRQCRKKALI